MKNDRAKIFLGKLSNQTLHSQNEELSPNKKVILDNLASNTGLNNLPNSWTNSSTTDCLNQQIRLSKFCYCYT